MLNRDPKKVRKLRALVKLLHTPRCRMQQIREYFGEDPGKPCGKCDYCRLMKER